MTKVTHFLGGFYVRAKRDGERVFGPFRALTPGHPLVGTSCMACGNEFETGHRSALVALGPDDAEARERWLAGRWCSVVAVALHAECAGAVENELLDLTF